MPNVIDIIIKAVDEASGTINKVDQNTEKLGKSVLSTIGQFVSWSAVIYGAKRALEDIVGSTVEYANQVRQLSTLSGESTEETSRFIQVLDDYKISADDALLATKALTKEGHTPSIETLAKLSDQYLALSTEQEKNEFVLKNLGKGGLQWVEVLNKGSKAIKEQGAGISKSLLLSQKQVDAARKLEIAQDSLNDSLMAAKITIGNELVPALTGVIDEFNRTTRAIEIMKDEGLNPLKEMFLNSDGYINALKQAGDEQIALQESMLNNADAAGMAGDAAEDEAQSLDKLKEAAKRAQDALDAMSERNTGLLGTIQDVADYNKEYAQKHKELVDEIAQDQFKLGQLRLMPNASDDSEAIQDLSDKIRDNQDALQDLEAEYLKWQNQVIFDLFIEKLKAGVEGFTDAEFEMALKVGESMGILDEASVRQAQTMNDVANSWAAAAQLTEREAALVKQALADLDGTTATVTIRTRHIEEVSSDERGTGMQQNAAGGSFIIPSSYGYEGFNMGGMATASGGEEVTISPANGARKGGATIIINNPTPEPASDSIERALLRLSILGVDF